MGLLLAFGAAAAGLLIGIFAGLKLGETTHDPKRYALYNLLALIVMIVLQGTGLLLRSAETLIFSGALFVGSVVGLRFGFGQALGAFRAMERMTGVEKSRSREEARREDGHES